VRAWIGLAPIVVWAGIASCVLTGCAALGVRPDAQALREKAEKEEAALLARVRVHDDPRLAEYLTGVAQRLAGPCRAGACPPPGPSNDRGHAPTLHAFNAAGVRITVIEDPTLAAFATPTGRLFLHTGLLGVVENEAQLAMILARELAHDTSRLQARAWNGPMTFVGLSPTAAAVLGLDLQLAAAAAIEGYGAEGEREADDEGLRRLVAAGYDPREALRVFERLAGDAADRGGLREIFFYGTRRRMGDRYETLRELVGRTRAEPTAVGHRDGDGGEFERRMLALVRDNAALDIRAGRFVLARRQLDRVLTLTPNDPIAQLHDGDWHRLRSQRAAGPARREGARRALERYERAIELDPGYAEPFRQLALLHYEQRDAARARAAFERYLALKPDAADAQRVREYLAILRE
jgi:predicted Zn-dependent protease